MATGVNLAGLRKRDGEKIPKLVKIFKQKQPLIFLINSGEERVVDEIIVEGKGFKTSFKPSDKNLDSDLKIFILDQ
jgi:hypothetical protein